MGRMAGLKREYESPAGRNQEIGDTFPGFYSDRAEGGQTGKRFLKLSDVVEKEKNPGLYIILSGNCKITGCCSI